METQTLENIAAIKLKILVQAIESAEAALRDVSSLECNAHAKELSGAAKIARTWIKGLRKMHRAKLPR